jgi:L-alanine-DL-glutamate epimerase-like enolase superfamily enzyme
MVKVVRNHGRPGVTSCAIAAVDIALWDLKARLHEQPLCRLLGMVRDEVPIYGSGGFTSLTAPELKAQLGAWVHDCGTARQDEDRHVVGHRYCGGHAPHRTCAARSWPRR